MVIDLFFFVAGQVTPSLIPSSNPLISSLFSHFFPSDFPKNWPSAVYSDCGSDHRSLHHWSFISPHPSLPPSFFVIFVLSVDNIMTAVAGWSLMLANIYMIYITFTLRGKVKALFQIPQVFLLYIPPLLNLPLIQ